MKQRFAALSLMAALTVVACITGAAFAQDDARDTIPARPKYARMTPKLGTNFAAPATPLKTWNGSFSFGGTIYRYNMVGTVPSSGASTTVKTFIIPLKMVFTTSTGPVTFTPTTKLTNGQTVIQNVVSSPIFNKGFDFTSNGVDLGSTQYIDAFQRGNFWGQVSKAKGYHVLLGGPTVLPVQTINVPKADGSVGNPLGVRVGEADLNWFDGQLQTIMAKFPQILPNTLPIFITYDVYLTQNGCCVGGYHNSAPTAAGQQSYAHATYLGTPGQFSQDVSALSHEVGEWMDDPLVVNNGNPVACGVLEVGDPEEVFSNFGDFPYTLNGFTYNLQDLTYLPYFGAPTSTSAGGSLTFKGNPFGLTTCSNGG